MGDCIFCRIAAREIPASLVYEDDQLLAFGDVNPQAPAVHTLIIPREHIPSLGPSGLDSRPTCGRRFGSRPSWPRGKAW